MPTGIKAGVCIFPLCVLIIPVLAYFSSANTLKENFVKPFTRLKSSIEDYKEEKIKDKNRFLRRVENYKYNK